MADVKARHGKLVRPSQAANPNSAARYNTSPAPSPGRADASTPAHLPVHRKKPFSSFIKRLTSLKAAASASYGVPSDTGNNLGGRQSGDSSTRRKRGGSGALNGRAPSTRTTGSIAFSIPHSSYSHDNLDRLSLNDNSSKLTADGTVAPSNATVCTSSYSYAASGFSSPTPSERSLTTTLTTIQSTAPNGGYNPHPNHHHNPNAPPVLFTNPISTPTSQPSNGGANHTYQTVTANGLLTDNASVITLASSSKHRRRHSMDTDASVRALAPSSLWGGSRESLPLSVLSANMEGRVGGERASIHSRTLDSSRAFVDASSIGGTSPIASPNRESYGYSIGGPSGVGNGKSSRRSSAWGELLNGEDDNGSLKSGTGSIKGSLGSARSGAIMQSERSPQDSEFAGNSTVESDVAPLLAVPSTAGVPQGNHTPTDQGGGRPKPEMNGN